MKSEIKTKIGIPYPNLLPIPPAIAAPHIIAYNTYPFGCCEFFFVLLVFGD
jgi:hypothetical protein